MSAADEYHVQMPGEGEGVAVCYAMGNQKRFQGPARTTPNPNVASCKSCLVKLKRSPQLANRVFAARQTSIPGA